MKTDIKTLGLVKELHECYRLEIESSAIKPLSRKTYISHSANFVRWISGDFEPGSKIKRIMASSEALQK